MAQLRDAKTSELIAEGTPEELVLIEQELANGHEVIYDGVGEGFDPQAVLAAHAENLQGLNGALANPDTPDNLKPALEEAVANAEAAIPNAGVIQEVQANIDEARKDWVEG